VRSAHSWRRVAARGLLGVAALMAVFALLATRVLIEGERELRASEALIAVGELEQAVVRARRSAGWYLPGAPHVGAAYGRLLSIAQMAEGRGEPKTALLAWQAIRAAALSSRWVVVPHPSELMMANAQIARLAARQHRPPGSTDRTDADLERELELKLQREEHPRVPWIAALLCGFGLITGGLAYVGARGLERDGTLHRSRLRIGLCVTVAGALAWALALWQA
jgi:hypothetical protein